MSPLRTRLAAVTCAAAVVLASGPVSGSAQAEAAVPSRTGLDRLLATDAGHARAIVTFDSVPTATEVAALRGLGLIVQPMKELPMALVAGPTAGARQGRQQVGRDVYPDETPAVRRHRVLQHDVVLARGRRGAALARASPARASPSASSTPAATAPTRTSPTTSSTT